MQNLTTPKATLIGLSLIALAIATTPFTSGFVQPAIAQSGIQKVIICDHLDPNVCAGVHWDFLTEKNALFTRAN